MPNIMASIENLGFQFDPAVVHLVVAIRVEGVAGTFGSFLPLPFGLSDAAAVATIRGFVIATLAAQSGIVVDPAMPFPIFGLPVTTTA